MSRRDGHGENVIADQLVAYAETFLSTLQFIASQQFSAEQCKHLAHLSLLPASINCYASTQHGVAFEYSKSSTTSFTPIRGTQRIEDMVFRAPRAISARPPLFLIGGSNVVFTNHNIKEGFPFRLHAVDADLKVYSSQFSSSRFGWIRKIEYLEMYANRLASNWTLHAAQSRAKDEVLAAIVVARDARINGVDLHEYISRYREKTVLVLGKYEGAGSDRISKIIGALTALKYNAITIRDVPDFEGYDLSQKLVAVASLCRFIVMDDSEPSGHLIEFAICRDNRWLTVVLRAGSHGSSWMTAGASATSTVMYNGVYNPEDALPSVTEAVIWAERRLKELSARYDSLYPWRLTTS